MPRCLDLACSTCDFEILDFFVMRVPEHVIHFPCGGEMTEVWRPRNRRAQWSERDGVVVFRDPATGAIRYPGRNDTPTPAGYERVEMRSLREVERFEREHNVRSEVAWFDKGSGRGNDDWTPPRLRDLLQGRER